MSGRATKLSSSVTVNDYYELVQLKRRPELGLFIVERFKERYFDPVSDSNSKHGFAIMAIACLVIETLEAFYQGRANTRNKSKEMFESFFNRSDYFTQFKDGSEWFYKDIRCGILHQAETRNGWRVRRDGALLDVSKKTINATKFINKLQDEVKKYSTDIQSSEIL